MKKSLIVSKKWYDWFYEQRIQLVTTINDGELFTRSIEVEVQGNHLNYQTIFKLIHLFKNTFDFLLIDNIRLIWCDELSQKDLQFYKEGQDYAAWRDCILKENYKIENPFVSDFEDSTDIYYNYNLSIEGDPGLLYKYNQTDRTALYLWYNPKSDRTHYKFEIELRKSLFYIDKDFQVNLSAIYTDQNLSLLVHSENHLLNEIKLL